MAFRELAASPRGTRLGCPVAAGRVARGPLRAWSARSAPLKKRARRATTRSRRLSRDRGRVAQPWPADRRARASSAGIITSCPRVPAMAERPQVGDLGEARAHLLSGAQPPSLRTGAPPPASAAARMALYACGAATSGAGPALRTWAARTIRSAPFRIMSAAGLGIRLVGGSCFAYARHRRHHGCVHDATPLQSVHLQRSSTPPRHPFHPDRCRPGDRSRSRRATWARRPVGVPRGNV